jgi:copper transport protein
VNRRLVALVAVVLAIFGGVGALTAAPAAAHAVVVSSSPGDGEVVPDAPREVQIQFSERVSADLGGLTVLDADGARVDNNDSRVEPTGDLLQASVGDDLDDGTYVMNYRVISADGHPITGAIVFGIGTDTTIDAEGVSGLRAGGETGFEIAAGVARFLTYGAGLLAAGLALFMAFVHDQRADRNRLAFLVRSSAVVAGLAGVAVVGFQAAIVSGEGTSAMVDPSMLRQALTEGLDWATVILLVGLAGVHLSADIRRLVTVQALAFYGALGIVGSFVFWGHSTNSDPRWLVTGSNLVHTSAAAIWLGGLVGLGLVLRRRHAPTEPAGDPAPEAALVSVAATRTDPTSPGADEPTEAGTGTGAGAATASTAITTTTSPADLVASTARIIGRFSTVAAVSVVALVVTGGVLAWAETRSIDALNTTTYGRVLMTKVGVVLVVLLAAAYNRFRLVPEIEADADDPDVAPDRLWSRLASTAWMEVAGIVVVLAVTAALVNITPARTAFTGGEVFNETAVVGDGLINVVVAPGDVGNNTVHIQYTDDVGRPTDLAREVEIIIGLPTGGVEPITRDVGRAGTGHFLAQAMPFPVAGPWEVTIVSRLSEFDQERTTFSVRIGS